MRFKGLDLNLLIALDALLTERNVSAAARKVFLSQSAMSGALARLREHFGDELLVPVGRRMVLTSAAELLLEPLRQLMLQIEATVGASLKFDASKSSRTFVVHASDYITEVVLSHVVPMIAHEAPGVILEIVPPLDDPAASLECGDVDLLITPESYASGHHPAELLYEEQHVVVGWRGNPVLSRPLSVDDFFSLGHVVTRFAPSRAIAFSESEIARMNRNRRIELVAPSFTSVPKLLIGTNRVGVMHRRLAENYAHTLPLIVQPLPFEMRPLREVIQYHQVRAADAGVHWLKGLIHRAATHPPN
jgi:LysR family transcriptional regulator, nod-box dependent transcriptional activator